MFSKIFLLFKKHAIIRFRNNFVNNQHLSLKPEKPSSLYKLIPFSLLLNVKTLSSRSCLSNALFSGKTNDEKTHMQKNFSTWIHSLKIDSGTSSTSFFQEVPQVFMKAFRKMLRIQLHFIVENTWWFFNNNFTALTKLFLIFLVLAISEPFPTFVIKLLIIEFQLI